ncbi:hypothetical protein J4E85_009160 [Alternaria conjuncta]|uniref:uncharacterized protein n=1 Tax=Alternaria conjuncta TaxID=181017 RepID=UPI00221FA2DD|nr:uncharacterized protein J4E85_009160 [Alternaria conjuncta]KAI4921045.1 hypothetical protein J4E85_009160 [Alternaria conjuncta]
MGNIAPELLGCCKGNILFIGHRAHLDMTSFRHIIDMMYMEYDKSLRQLGDKRKGYIPGVRINCIGDQLISDRPSLETCKVTDGFYEKDESLLMWIASKLGIDLFARTLPPALPWRNRSGGYKGLNHAWNFGFAQLNPSEWSASLGSLCVARKDKKPLFVTHIAALMAYLYSIGSGQVQRILDSKEPWNLASKFDEAFEMHNDVLLEKASRVGFERFWTKWMEEEGRWKYGDVPSPSVGLLLHLLPFLGLALATPLLSPAPPPPLSHAPAPAPAPAPPLPPLHPHTHAPKTNIKCPLIFDGRITKNLTLQSFDTATGGTPYNPDYVKGENRTWSSILLFPKTTPPSRFDNPLLHKPVEVTIDSGSLFRAGENLQTGFRRAGLLFKDDLNDAGTDASDNGVVTFHWSIRQDEHRPLNLSHEYMNVWHEKGDYSGNQFMFVGGVVLVGDGGTGLDTKKEREMWKVQNAKNEFVFQTRILRGEWQNLGVQLDYVGE